MGQANSDQKPDKKPTKKIRKSIRPCLIPGHYYFVDDLIQGGLAGSAKFTEWFRKGLKPLALGTKRYVVSADQIIALGLMDEKPE